MRIAELSAATGVSVPTIKYYLRSGLVPSGELTSRNQANYGPDHVRRLHLVRALVEVGGLSIATVSEVLEAIGTTPQDSVHCLLGLVQYGMDAPKPPNEGDALEAARATVADLVQRRGWHTDPQNTFGEALAAALSAAAAIGHGDIAELLDPYADACERIAAAEIESTMRAADEPVSGATGGLERMLERAVVGTVLGDTIIAALRRLAHQHHSSVMFGEHEHEHEHEEEKEHEHEEEKEKEGSG